MVVGKLSEIAVFVAISPFHLIAQFTKATHETPTLEYTSKPFKPFEAPNQYPGGGIEGEGSPRPGGSLSLNIVPPGIDSIITQ